MNKPLLISRVSGKKRLIAALAFIIVGLTCYSSTVVAQEKKTLRIPMRTDGPKTLDPAQGSTTYENKICGSIYETLLQYKYLVRPYTLEPLLLAEMPTISADGTRYRFKLKEGVRFADADCFPDGKGRALESKDILYSWKRIADSGVSNKSWWLMKDTIVGFDKYREEQNKAEKFDYDAPVEGMVEINKREFEIILKAPRARFLYTLAMFQLSAVPREAVEKYGKAFNFTPVGTGPFVLREWVNGQKITLDRNPNYHACTYPAEHMPEDKTHNLHLAARSKLPILDTIEISMFIPDQPLWLEYKANNLGYIQVPDTFMDQVFKRRRGKFKLQKEMKAEGHRAFILPLLDFIFRGFNMEDKVIGGYDDKRRALRQAICHVLDWHETNTTFYKNSNVVYDGPIPPNLEGHPENHTLPNGYTYLNLEKAQELMVKAGYGPGKTLELDYYTSRGGNNAEQAELLKKQLAKIGVELNVQLRDFSQLIEAINAKKAQFFSFAWGSDYPDAENNLQLFYGPNESPGSNHYNYKNPKYDALYEKVRAMQPGPERTALYVQMRDLVLEDCPTAGSMARNRYYLIHPNLKNSKPDEVFSNWYKYLDVAK